MPDVIREHDVTLRGPRLVLRPMTENDWDTLLRWNQDAEVLYFADHEVRESWTLEQIHDIYRGTSQKAFNFIMELEGRPIGECWLQEMNLTRLLSQHPGEDLRRIDLMIGEKTLWGQGLGTEAIRLLTDFGFVDQHCDRLFACGVADYNPRSAGAFRRCGYQVTLVLPEKSPKMRFSFDLCLTRGMFRGRRQKPRVLNLVDLAGTMADWQPLEDLAEVVFAPPDPQVLAFVLPDFDAVCVPEGLALTTELLHRARRVRLVMQEMDFTAELGSYMDDHGIRGLTVGAHDLVGALRRRLEGLQ